MPRKKIRTEEETKEHRRRYRQKHQPAYNKQYYGKTANSKRAKVPWSKDEEEVILRHMVSDTELSEILKRSVKSIQIKRARLWADMEDYK